MRRFFLYAKIHQATVTQADLNYEGSFSIDAEILETSGIQENEQIHVLNITNGNRFVTYAIKAPRYSRTMGANGACARLVSPGDKIIICAYAELEASEMTNFSPKIVLMKDENHVNLRPESIPAL